jgi:glycosyltransferase involved in cell wall biosynthesis
MINALSIPEPALLPERRPPGGPVEAPWLRHLGLLNDYVWIPHAAGSSFATRFLRREFRARGHDVTIVGPEDPAARAGDMPDKHVTLKALPMRNHPGVRMPFPTRRELARVAAQRFDLVLGNTNTELNELGVWLRATQHIPYVCVNTLHLPSVYNVVLPDRLLRSALVRGLFNDGLVPWIEEHSAGVYNQSDSLIVLARGLARSWRERGVEVPIHVIPRAVDPKIFDADAGADPFDASAVRGQRLLVVCRHAREKGVARLLEIFARQIAPRLPHCSLTLVGDGPEYDAFRALARDLGVKARCFFPGEFAVTEMPRFYRHADLFVYTSLSETYGQVVGEAMWCGLPVVALEDGMGISDQVEHGSSGYLVPPGASDADAQFGAHVVRLLQTPPERRALAEQALRSVRVRSHPARVMSRYYEVFEQAREHCRATTERRIADARAASAALRRWYTFQSLVVGLSYVRRPAVVNRHGRRQPSWAGA